MMSMLALVFSSYIASAQKAEIFSTDGKAIRGYDVVAFFQDGKAIKGTTQYALTWKEAEWLFSSKEHLETFKANPEHYAPQYGGYCAYGVAEGHKAPTETDTWSIVNDKLYLNYNKKVKETWSKNQQGFINKANVQWKTVKDQQ